MASDKTAAPDYVPAGAADAWLKARAQYEMRRSWLIDTGKMHFMPPFEQIPRQQQNDWIRSIIDGR
jgi:hypothetical protein